MKLIQYPDPVLTQMSEPFSYLNEEIVIWGKTLEEMEDLMVKMKGAGLAAVQVGWPTRIATIDLSKEDPVREPFYIVNPEILSMSDPIERDEGCVSLMSITEKVTRYKKITYSYTDLRGNETVEVAEGLHAHVIQHEIDHMNGTLFIDHLTIMKKDMVIRKHRKWIKRMRRTIDGAIKKGLLVDRKI